MHLLWQRQETVDARRVVGFDWLKARFLQQANKAQDRLKINHCEMCTCHTCECRDFVAMTSRLPYLASELVEAGDKIRELAPLRALQEELAGEMADEIDYWMTYRPVDPVATLMTLRKAQDFVDVERGQYTTNLPFRRAFLRDCLCLQWWLHSKSWVWSIRRPWSRAERHLYTR